jgi:REP element-mobilizing transposase RayT
MLNSLTHGNFDPNTWRSRGYLPHFIGQGIPQSITFRLADSLPASKLREWERELVNARPEIASSERIRRIEEYLDLGAGEKWLANEQIADIVEKALLWFDGERYNLHSWVVMPNHVHVMITPLNDVRLSEVLHSWKSFAAKKANKILVRTGSFWQQEYYDRFIRTEQHFRNELEYIALNPVKAGLCDKPETWRFSSAFWRRYFDDW